MVCYLVRHGKDDDTVRGGWSTIGLSESGKADVAEFAQFISNDQANLSIKHIYSSDLKRALETAQLISDKINVSINLLSNFREVNNGELAGMPNDKALELYPNLFWQTLEWDEEYPQGESPKDFFERIRSAWTLFSNNISIENENVILVTHSGVINVILHLINGTSYSNKGIQRKVPHNTLIPLMYENGEWHNE